VDAIEAGFEEWRADGEAAASELGALLAAAVHLTEQMDRWQAESWKRLLSGERSFDFQAWGSRLAEGYALCLAVFDRVENGLEAARDLSLDREGVQAFGKARSPLLVCTLTSAHAGRCSRRRSWKKGRRRSPGGSM
jgi:hypothetical protein